jgi:monothiol glutaredoxin
MQFNKVPVDLRSTGPIRAAFNGYGGHQSVDVNERIKKQLESYPVLLYMKGTPDFPQCGFSAKTVSVLRAIGAKFAYINIFEDPEVREGLKVYSNWPTFPQLYVNGELIGGCDIAVELYQSGELKQILDAATAPQTAQ